MPDLIRQSMRPLSTDRRAFAGCSISSIWITPRATARAGGSGPVVTTNSALPRIGDAII